MNQILNKEANRSHSKDQGSFSEIIQALKAKIGNRGHLPHVTIEGQLAIVDQMCEFPLGRYILERRGANGFWTDYMISHPDEGRKSGLNIEGKPFSAFEDYFLNRCPIVVAHQERFRIFQSLIQKYLKEGSTLASIPCGIMRDLLTLDFSKINSYKLVGVDIDEESLLHVKNFAYEKGIANIELFQQNSWEANFKAEFDLITSSGLNVYESDPLKVLDLYARFFEALKPGGVLIISVLTYPPDEATQTDWNLEGISQETLLLDRILHRDILEIKWRNFRSCNELDREFKQVGFSDVEVYFDKHRVFPTILAKKARF